VKSFIEKSWQKHHPVMWLMLPLVLLYWLITAIRRLCYKMGIKSVISLPVPVIIVGNLTVGGNGKTPVVVWLVQLMQRLNYNVGVISRGYGGSNDDVLLVNEDTDPSLCGDEPKLITAQTSCLLVVGRDRVKAAQTLIEHAKANNTPLDFIVSDDGLQHYRLGRVGEIVVIDGKRRFGNDYLLPMGPNREGQWRLNNAMMRINNGGPAQTCECLMTLAPQQILRVKDNQPIDQDLTKADVIAMAGIGYPQRFFDTLNTLSINPSQCHAFDDHQAFDEEQLHQLVKPQQWLMMTEKDAVKCAKFAQDNWCYLPVKAQLSHSATQQIQQKLEEFKDGI